MSSYGYYPLIGILIEPKSVEVSFLGRIGQVEQVCLNLKQNIWLDKRKARRGGKDTNCRCVHTYGRKLAKHLYIMICLAALIHLIRLLLS